MIKHGSTQRNSIALALHDLLRIGVTLLKEGTILYTNFETLLDCGRPKIQSMNDNGIALDDVALSELLEYIQNEVGGDTAITVAKYLLNSRVWGLASLGPLTTDKVQQILFFGSSCVLTKRLLQITQVVCSSKDVVS